MPQNSQRDARPGASVARLERVLDAWPLRLLGRVTERVRRVHAARRRKRVAAVQASLGSAPSAGALSALLQGGALESAIAMAEPLARGPAGSSPGAVQALAETWLMCGERARARELALTHREALRRSDRGVGLLEVVGLGGDDLWLPSGRPNVFAISRRLREDRMGGEQLAAALLRRPQAWLRCPELPLLLHSALLERDPGRALAFFNRFLTVHGLLPLAATFASGAPWLAGLRSEVPVVRSGPLVTVVIAARNAANTLGYALDSLLTQSYQSVEILACDDASDDDTRALLEARSRREPRLRAFRSLRQQGAYNVRNALLAEARGQLLTFHDADDFALPMRIEQQVGSLARGGTVASLGNGLRIEPRGDAVFFKDMKATRLSRVSLMLTRQAFRACGPFRSVRVGGDADLQAKLRNCFGTGVARLSAPLILSAWSPSSVTRTAGTESLEDGYRSPLRRAYSELVFRQYAAGYERLGDEALLARLREMGNWIEPSGIAPL